MTVSRPSGLQPLTFDWKQFYSTVVFDGIEEIMNSGPEAAADLVEGRMKQAEITTANKFETMLCGDGTGKLKIARVGYMLETPESFAYSKRSELLSENCKDWAISR